MRDGVQSEEDEMQSSSDSGTEDSDVGTLQESEEILFVGRRLAWLKIGSSFGSIMEENESVEEPPL